MLDKFKELFCGLDVAYGEYYLNGERDNKTGKEKGRATTKRGPVTDELFQKHLNGEINLGIIPIRSDNSCTWGCIDVDKYDLDYKSLIKFLKSMSYLSTSMHPQVHMLSDLIGMIPKFISPFKCL